MQHERGKHIRSETLVEALNADKRRYEEAYHAGYEACRKKYEERLSKIAVLAHEEEPGAAREE